MRPLPLVLVVVALGAPALAAPADAPVDERADVADEVPAAAEADAPALLDAPSLGPEAAPAPEPPPPEPRDEMNELPPPSLGLGEMIGPLLKTLLMLGVVVAIAYLTLHKGLGKLVERQNIGKRVKVVERTSLDTKRTLFLVEIDGKQMLLAAGEGGVVHLKDVENRARDDDAPVAPSKPVVARFGDLLKKNEKVS